MRRIYTDGSCVGNPGPGAWAYLAIPLPGETVEGGRHFAAAKCAEVTTNNRMEMLAAIMALRAFPKEELEIISDSHILVQGASKWITGWIKKGWTTSKGQPVENRDLWEQINDLSVDRNITWTKVSGHSGIPGNTEVDHYCQAIARQDDAAIAKAVEEVKKFLQPMAEMKTRQPIDTKPAVMEAKPIQVDNVINITITMAVKAANPAEYGPVGFGAVIEDTETSFEIPGRGKKTTEPSLGAAGLLHTIKAMKGALQNKNNSNKIKLRVASNRYITSCLRSLDIWAANNWKKKDGNPVAHAAKWAEIHHLLNEMVDGKVIAILDERTIGIDPVRDSAMRIAEQELDKLINQ